MDERRVAPELKTYLEYTRNGRMAERTGEPVNGVKGEEVGTTYGASHWKNEKHFVNLLSDASKTQCCTYYKIQRKDILKQGTPSADLLNPDDDDVETPKNKGKKTR